MANVLLRQPNGLLAMFDTITDNFIYMNMMEEEAKSVLIETSIKNAISEAKKNFSMSMQRMEEHPHLVFSWNRAIESMKNANRGKSEIDKVFEYDRDGKT